LQSDPAYARNPALDGAVGDGTTDDTAAIQAALATGSNVILERGKTYLIAGTLRLAAPGQIFFGNGAKLKRRAQYETFTQSAVASGNTTQITVIDASNVRVGHGLVLENNGNYDPEPRTVTAINGNDITVGTPFGITSTSGANVWLGFFAIQIVASDCRVLDLEFDGNKSNWTFYRWDPIAEINIEKGGDRATIERCYLHDIPSEGVLTGNCVDVRVLYNTILNANGNGVHYGGYVSGPINYGGRVVGNHIENVNLDPATGHADGCVVLSAAQADFLVAQNRLLNGISGVGSIDATDNLDITIIGNEIRSCTSTAIEGNCPSGDSSTNVLIEANRIYDCTVLMINQQSPSSSNFPSRWTVRGNLFSRTKLSVSNSRQVVIEGNIFNAGGASIDLIEVVGSKYVVVSGNQGTGGNQAVLIGGTGEQISVSSNVCVGQSASAINVYSDNIPNLSIVDNVISGDSSADPINYDAIRVRSKNVCRGNVVQATQGRSCIYLGSGSYQSVKDNVCRKGLAQYTIRIENTVSKAIVKDNETDAPISDRGTATTIAGNLVIA
jgi:hypothetical protein